MARHPSPQGLSPRPPPRFRRWLLRPPDAAPRQVVDPRFARWGAPEAGQPRREASPASGDRLPLGSA
jgi:hypothetical protein